MPLANLCHDLGETIEVTRDLQSKDLHCTNDVARPREQTHRFRGPDGGTCTVVSQQRPHSSRSREVNPLHRGPAGVVRHRRQLIDGSQTKAPHLDLVTRELADVILVRRGMSLTGRVAKVQRGVVK